MANHALRGISRRAVPARAGLVLAAVAVGTAALGASVLGDFGRFLPGSDHGGAVRAGGWDSHGDTALAKGVIDSIGR